MPAGRRGPAQPIQRPKSLAVLVAERLRKMILDGDYALGEMLSEEKVAATFNVSRTPVREAMTILQLQGLISIIPQRGSFVFKPSMGDLQELVQYRLMLELQAVKLAMDNDPMKAAAALGKVVAAMRKASENDQARTYMEADSAFHQVFFKHCGNSYLSQAYEIVDARIAALRANLAEPLEMHRGRTLAEHIQIAEDFEAGKLDAVLATLEVHITNMLENYSKAITAIEEAPVRGRRG